MLTTADVGLSFVFASFSRVRVGGSTVETELQQGVMPPTALVKGQKPLIQVSNARSGGQGASHILGTAPAGNGVVVVGTARQHSQVAVDGCREVGVVPGIDRSPVGSSTPRRSRSRSPYGPRTTLGPVVHAAHEAAIVHSAAGINKREISLAARTFEKFSLPLVLGRLAIVGLLNSACSPDHIYRSKASISHIHGYQKYGY